MSGARSDQSESRDILTDHAYPLTNKDSDLDILEVVERFVSDKYSGSVGVVMMRGSEDQQFLRVTSRQSDRMLLDQPLLHLNISLANNSKLLCQLLTYNRQLYTQKEFERESILEVGLMIEDLSQERYKTCEGMALDQSHLEKTDLCNLLIEKYDRNIVYRSKSCKFLVDRQDEAGRTNCTDCAILASNLRASLNVSTQQELTTDSTRKKRGRPKGSKMKLESEDENRDIKKVVKNVKEPSEILPYIPDIPDIDELESFQDDSEDYSPSAEKPKFQPPAIPKSAKHFCPHDSCSARFVTLQQMKTHLAGHEFVHCGRPAVICTNPRCSSVFHSQQELVDHLPVHKERRHACSVCPKSFATKQDLKIHSRTHSGEKPYQCNFCEKRFAIAQQLQVHQAVHTRERNHLCSDCGKSFYSQSTLIDHRKRKHLNIFPHKCPQCPKSFFTKQELAAHIRTHTGEKPFKCSICSKYFSRIYHQRRHIETVHSQKNIGSSEIVETETHLEITEDGKIIKTSDSECCVFVQQ